MPRNCDNSEEVCEHCYTIDLIDIDPDRSQIVYSCDYCGDIQTSLPSKSTDSNAK